MDLTKEVQFSPSRYQKKNFCKYLRFLSLSDCNRRVFKETRLCLALLYGLLFQYRLREAQALGDHMARLILYSDGHLNQDYITSASGLLGSTILDSYSELQYGTYFNKIKP